MDVGSNRPLVVNWHMRAVFWIMSQFTWSRPWAVTLSCLIKKKFEHSFLLKILNLFDYNKHPTSNSRASRIHAHPVEKKVNRHLASNKRQPHPPPPPYILSKMGYILWLVACDVTNNGRHLGRHFGFYEELEMRLKPREMAIFVLYRKNKT